MPYGKPCGCGEYEACYKCMPDLYKDTLELMNPSSKPSNPKDLIGTDKVPLSLVPGSAIAYQSLGHLEGHLKYGLVNWREAGVRFSIYIDALLRHTQKLLNGEWEDSVTKVPHLGSMGACINIIIDAYESGKLIDDRPKQAPVSETIDRLGANVKHLRQLYADRAPHHYFHEPVEGVPHGSPVPTSQDRVERG